jgi:DNA-binding response OmpR family regulator
MAIVAGSHWKASQKKEVYLPFKFQFMHKPKILLVEDDPNLAFVIRDILQSEGFHLDHADDGKAGLELFRTQPFDLCLLDVMLPGMDGFNLGKKIREENAEVPILFLTARDDEKDRIGGFQLGADDYITKPFSMKELVFRIRVFLKRSSPARSPATGVLPFDYDNLLLISENEEVKLTQREADLLNYLILHQEKVCKREDILKDIWGDDDYFLGRSLDVFVSRLRKLLKPFPHVEISNYHGVGFKLKVKDG